MVQDKPMLVDQLFCSYREWVDLKLLQNVSYAIGRVGHFELQ